MGNGINCCERAENNMLDCESNHIPIILKRYDQKKRKPSNFSFTNHFSAFIYRATEQHVNRSII